MSKKNKAVKTKKNSSSSKKKKKSTTTINPNKYKILNAQQHPLTIELINYCNNIMNDIPLSCKKHKWSCQRFLEDLEKQGTKNFPYIFDPERAEDFLGWMRLFNHHQCVLAGTPIEPDIIQKFNCGNIYGWIHKTSKQRRFRKFYWQVARKNVKTQTLALIGKYETMAFKTNETMEVYCAATKRAQAKIVWDEAKHLLRNSEYFKNSGAYKISYDSITHIKTGSTFKTLSRDDKKTGDGLHPQCGIIDEYHAHETSEYYDVIDSGMGFKAEPLLGIITTAGFDLTYPCYHVEYNLVSKILNPDIDFTIDSYFVMINELEKDEEGNLMDDIKDPKVWVKANPIVCTYKEGRRYLKDKLKEALEAPEKMRNFLTKHMDVWIMMKEAGYMHMGKWRNCKGKLPDLKKAECFLGLDLSAKHDLTSVGFEFKIKGKYIVFSHSFMPEETVAARQKIDKVPYMLWVKQGWITSTPGAVTDYTTVMNWCLDKAKEEEWFIEEWCVDPWNAQQMSADLIEEGQTPVDIIQGIKTLSEPTKDFRLEVLKKNVIHDGNPVLQWAISNAVVDEVDKNKNIMLNKKKSKQRIDPIAALINAHVRARLKIEPTYNKRGMRKFG